MSLLPISGDGRVNENVALTSVHTAFTRYHNKLTDKLMELNPHWDEDRVYHEARKLMGGLWQHIVFNEYLPLVVGPAQMKKYGLELQKSGFSDCEYRALYMVFPFLFEIQKLSGTKCNENPTSF